MSTRVERLALAVREQKLDALVITNMANLRWATGFTGTNGLAVVGPAMRLFFTDFRYLEQAEQQVPEFDRVRAGQNPLADVATRLSGRRGVADPWVSVRSHTRLQDALDGGAELAPASGIVERLRE